MAKAVCLMIEAPAKINLHLEILGRRDDGYHDLRSLFISVSLADRLIVRSGRGRGGTKGPLVAGVDDRENTVLKAVERFRHATGIDAAFEMTVEKRIPMGAGLGGGSSDAAAALTLCNLAAGSPLDTNSLLKLGAEIGCDVPFFLTSACALVEGRGELVTPLPPPPELSIALFVPDFSVSTADAYRWFDREPHGHGRQLSRETIVRNLFRRSPQKWDYDNSFAPILFKRFPLYETLRQGLVREGALFTGVSGSGSSYFGVFKDRSRAERAVSRLPGRYRYAGVVTPLDELPSVREGG